MLNKYLHDIAYPTPLPVPVSAAVSCARRHLFAFEECRDALSNRQREIACPYGHKVCFITVRVTLHMSVPVLVAVFTSISVTVTGLVFLSVPRACARVCVCVAVSLFVLVPVVAL
jgi:hypothetical protein